VNATPTPTVIDAAAALGFRERDGEEFAVVQFTPDWRPIHTPLRDASGLSLDRDTYLSTGSFRAGTITRTGGRTVDNLASIVAMPFDLDLSSYTTWSPDEVRALSDAELDELLTQLQRLGLDTFAALGLPVHRIDETGYGAAFWIYLADGDRGRISEIRALHKRIGEMLNAHAGFALADERALDAGTRIMRLPPCKNTKRRDRVRESRTIHYQDETAALDDLAAVAGVAPSEPPPVPAAVGDRIMPDRLADQIVAAVAPAYVEGKRHALAFALAGMLATAGVAERQTADIVDRVAAGDAEAHDRRRAVETTYQRLASGRRTAGYTALRAVLPQDTLAFVGKLLDDWRAATAATITFGGGAPAPTADDAEIARWYMTVDPLPEAARYGLVDDWIGLAAPTTEAADQFHAAAFLTVCSAIAGRRFWQHYSGQLHANLFTLLVGNTGTSRKDTAINRVMSVVSSAYSDPERMIAPPFYVETDVASAEGLVHALRDHPLMLLRLSEFTSVVSKSKRAGSGNILDAFLYLYDTPDEFKNPSKNNPATAKLPTLSVLAATQPARLAQVMDHEALTSGFGNRFLIVPGVGKASMPDPPPINRSGAMALYREVIDRMNMLHEANGRRPVEIAFDDACRLRWQEYYDRTQEEQRADDGLSEMRTRYPTNTRKIAMLHAVLDSSTRVLPRHFDAALAFTEWSWQQIQRLMVDWGVSIDAQIENRINGVLLGGPLPKRILRQRASSRKWSSPEFNRVLKAMSEVGTVVVDAQGVVHLASRYAAEAAS